MKPEDSAPQPQFTLQSAKIGTLYQLYSAEIGKGGPRRLVVVLDGDDQFSAAVAAAESLTAEGVLPPMRMLGVGYGGGYRSPKNRRGRDYTPSKVEGEPMETGGAEAFHDFLADELIPWAAGKFDFLADDLTITGNSISGLFVLFALLRSRPLFRRGLAGSPSIWWDNRSILALAAANPPAPDSPACRLFLCAGADDSQSMHGDLALLTDQLAQSKRSNLTWEIAKFPGLDHYTALPSSFSAGLRGLFSGR